MGTAGGDGEAAGGAEAAGEAARTGTRGVEAATEAPGAGGARKLLLTKKAKVAG